MRFSQIATVARSEYIRRVRTKSFILGTLLGPLIILLLMFVPAGVMLLSEGGDKAQHVALVDETGELFSALQDALPENVRLEDRSNTISPRTSAYTSLLSDSIHAVLVIPASAITEEGSVSWYSQGEGGLFEQERLQEAITAAVREQRVRQAGADDAILDAFASRVAFHRIDVGESGETSEGTARMIASSAIGYILGMFLFFAIFLYGTFVMRGVIEEKANRIVEVIVSSVRPFELMMGKVFGIGALGLTQLAAWAVLIAAGAMASGPIVARLLGPDALEAGSEADVDLAFLENGPTMIADIFSPGLLLALPLFYLGGYLLFASLYAAVGSAVDQEADAQQFIFPITMIVLIPIMLMPQVIGSPNDTLAVALSLIPLTSPIIMVARMAIVSVPFWQVALALVLLFAGFVGMIWLAARIYRVGILMTGKKASFGEIVRWARSSG